MSTAGSRIGCLWRYRVLSGARSLQSTSLATRPWYLSKSVTGLMLGDFLGDAENFLLLSPVLLRAATVSGDSLTKMAHAQADILFKPPLENIDLLDWQACDQAIETGHRHAVEKLEQLRKPLATCTPGITTEAAL
jgi:hypothetical protein